MRQTNANSHSEYVFVALQTVKGKDFSHSLLTLANVSIKQRREFKLLHSLVAK